jgi:hypothetical protein
MTRGDLVFLIADYAKQYRKAGVLESVARNRHMNQYEGEQVSPQTIDAILVDFVNFVGVKQGIDLAMYTSDLDEKGAKGLNVIQPTLERKN